MDVGVKLACILIVYFVLGAVLMYRINRRKDHNTASQNWLKYLVYLGLIFFQFIVIYWFNSYFKLFGLCIILFGFFELIRLEMKSQIHYWLFFIPLLVVSSILFGQFYSFSLLETPILLLTFFTVSAFDAFSQMTGQLFGKSKLVPRISPNKTVGGLVGGILCGVLTALLIGNILAFEFYESLFWGICISISAFLGDLAASAVKRQYQVKDFSRLIPGHGGYLDRFDSFILAGAVVALLNRLI
jgi:phosphatidate cytidylyltransferase